MDQDQTKEGRDIGRWLTGRKGLGGDIERDGSGTYGLNERGYPILDVGGVGKEGTPSTTMK